MVVVPLRLVGGVDAISSVRAPNTNASKRNFLKALVNFFIGVVFG
jgi:hypothetical protein